LEGFQKTNFDVSSAEGAGNIKIGFIMRIAGELVIKIAAMMEIYANLIGR